MDKDTRTAVLEILDRIEAMRLRAFFNPEHYTVDYVLRTAEGIIASEFGFYGTQQWKDELRKIPTSELHKRSYNIY